MEDALYLQVSYMCHIIKYETISFYPCFICNCFCYHKCPTFKNKKRLQSIQRNQIMWHIQRNTKSNRNNS